VTEFHGIGAWIAIGLTGATGIWGLFLAAIKRQPGPLFKRASLVAVAVMLAQGAVGLVLFAGEGEPGSGHLFYGMIIAATVAFAYIYRAEIEKRAALAWGLLLLFLMGAGFRAVANIGTDFGG